MKMLKVGSILFIGLLVFSFLSDFVIGDPEEEGTPDCCSGIGFGGGMMIVWLLLGFIVVVFIMVLLIKLLKKI